ncbi:MAG: redoxin domain-containing protein [Chloroflexi bacterium]|nr:redoxin domain-containing protein [Chloroflexota bacterium]
MTQNPLSVGVQAPDFTAIDQDGRAWRLADALARSTQLLFFYRGDWRPYCNGQAVSFARKYDQITGRGAEIIGITVDTPEQNQAMIGKLLLPYSIVSDPEGDDVIKRYGVWDEKGRIAQPSIVVVGQDGTIRWSYTGRDFADRPLDAELFAALDAARGG